MSLFVSSAVQLPSSSGSSKVSVQTCPSKFASFTGLKSTRQIPKVSFHRSSQKASFSSKKVRPNFVFEINATSDVAATEFAARDENSYSEVKPKKVLNVGVIGAGRIGLVHADNLAYRIKNARLVSVASGRMESAERCSRLTGCKAMTDYQEMLEDPNVDAVVICTSSDTHTQIVLEAAAAGKHIFCEKPVDLSLANVDKCKEAVEKAGVKFMVGLNRRFDANFMRVRQAIQSGEVGDVHRLHIISRDPAPPPISYVKKSGGIFLDMTMHDFDMALFLMGDHKVTELFCMADCMVDPEIGKCGDVDTSMISMRFDNGVICTIDNSRQAVYGYDQRVEAFGSKGSISTLNNYPNNAILSTGTEIKRDLPLNFFMDRYADSFVNIMADFVTNVLEDKPMSVNIQCGRDPIVMALAARKSYEEKRMVKLSEVDLVATTSV